MTRKERENSNLTTDKPFKEDTLLDMAEYSIFGLKHLKEQLKFIKEHKDD